YVATRNIKHSTRQTANTFLMTIPPWGLRRSAASCSPDKTLLAPGTCRIASLEFDREAHEAWHPSQAGIHHYITRGCVKRPEGHTQSRRLGHRSAANERIYRQTL